MPIESPLAEITLRKYEKPYSTSSRELVKKTCLSLGLLQPGDSRDIVVDILLVLKKAAKEKKALSSDEIKDQAIILRKENNLELKGIAESNIRRQLKKLRDLFLVEKKANQYNLTEFSTFSDLFNKKIESFYLNDIVSRVKEYLDEFDKI